MSARTTTRRNKINMVLSTKNCCTQRCLIIVVFLAVLVCLAAVIPVVVAADSSNDNPQNKQQGRPFKNVIVLIPDGCDDGVVDLARWYKNDPLQVDEMSSGKHHPYMTDSIMTDSAPGGTAISTGQLTSDKFVGVGPHRNKLLSNLNEEDLWEEYAPIPNILEKAKTMGMSTGLVSTSRVTHATPASFSAHVHDRFREEEIAKQMVFNGIDVVMGGGREYLLPKPKCYPEQLEGNSSVEVIRQTDLNTTTHPVPSEGKRGDCLDLEEELRSRGYEMCYTRQQLLDMDASTPGKKVWCSFAEHDMQPDIDRKFFAENEPSLAEMTNKTIELLSQNDDGFFLMVEGSQVDWAGHANDPVWIVTDFIAWDDAVRVAVDFAKEDGETLVVALPDHNTGGLTVGNYKHEYTDCTVEQAREPLLKMKMTSEGVTKKMEEKGVDLEKANTTDLQSAVWENWGINITQEEATNVLEYSEKYSKVYKSSPRWKIPLHHALARLVSEEYTIAGWTTHGHTGDTVPIWVYGIEAPKGVIRNIEAGQILDDALGGGLAQLASELYVDVDTTNLTWSVDRTNMNNQFALIEGYTFPFNTDYFLNNGDRILLPGITVYAPKTGKLYVSREAIEKVQSLA